MKVLRIIGLTLTYPAVFGIGMGIAQLLKYIYYSYAIEYINLTTTILFNK